MFGQLKRFCDDNGIPEGKGKGSHICQINSLDHIDGPELTTLKGRLHSLRVARNKADYDYNWGFAKETSRKSEMLALRIKQTLDVLESEYKPQ